MIGQSWFWCQGYQDAIEGRSAIVPDHTRHQWQRADYFAGYEAGEEDRVGQEEESK